MKIKKQIGLSGAVVVTILILAGVAVGSLTYILSLDVSDKAVEGSYDAYETITGEAIARPESGPLSTFPVSGNTNRFTERYYDNFHYEAASETTISARSKITMRVDQPIKHKNHYVVTLTYLSPIDLSTVRVTPDAAAAIVVDVSGSMKWDIRYTDKSKGANYCYEPTCSNYGKICKFNNSTCGWRHGWGIDFITGVNYSRFKVAAEGLDTFLTAYADQSGGRRMASFIRFATFGENVLGWADVNEAANFNTFKNAFAYDSLTNDIERIYTYTAQSTGLEKAYEALKDPAVANNPNKFVVLVTDGCPDYSSYSSLTPKLPNEDSGLQASNVANKIENELDATIQVIGFGTNGIKMKKTTRYTYVNDWLKNDIATSPSDFYSAETLEELVDGLAHLQQQIADASKMFTIEAPFGACVKPGVVTSPAGKATVQDGKLVWSIMEDEPQIFTDKDGEQYYQYEISYEISIDTEDPLFVSGDFYPVHNFANMSYIDVNVDGSITPGTGIQDLAVAVPSVFKK